MGLYEASGPRPPLRAEVSVSCVELQTEYSLELDQVRCAVLSELRPVSLRRLFAESFVEQISSDVGFPTPVIILP